MKSQPLKNIYQCLSLFPVAINARSTFELMQHYRRCGRTRFPQLAEGL
uniref:Uncharacterized protein n=1 Tax=Rhizophora mucronata TaxID=61149 RepID=A0A2P2QLM3_RHIMU